MGQAAHDEGLPGNQHEGPRWPTRPCYGAGKAKKAIAATELILYARNPRTRSERVLRQEGSPWPAPA